MLHVTVTAVVNHVHWGPPRVPVILHNAEIIHVDSEGQWRLVKIGPRMDVGTVI